jgi:hypothetical protein
MEGLLNSETMEKFIDYFGIVMKIVLFLFIVGVFNNKISYFLEINSIIKVFISIYLIYRFNTYRTDKVTFTNLDRKLVFISAVYILILSFADIITIYLERLRHMVIVFTSPILNRTVSATK